MSCNELHWRSGDAGTPILVRLLENGLPPQLGDSVTVTILNENGSEAYPESTDGITIEPAKAVTVSGERCLCVNHGFVEGQQVTVAASVFPSLLAAGTRYFVKSARPNDFRLATAVREAALSITGGTSVTVKPVGCVTWLPPADIPAGSYRVWFRVGESTGNSFGFPTGIPLIVLP
jgi:hypothetical protein